MCGRYAAATDPQALSEEFETTVPDERLEADYNVAPTKRVYIVVERGREDVRERSLEIARWGLVPSWAKDPSIGSRLVNARVETLAEKPSFRSAYAKRRCLVPADGFYEWYQPVGEPAGRRPAKQPYFIARTDGHPLAMAGLYEWWADPAADKGDPVRWLLTCTVITTSATDDLGRIHDRMPMAVRREDWRAWLDPATPIAPDRLLVPAADAGLVATAVSTLVNDVRNNGPELLEPLAASDLPTLTLGE